MAKETLTRQICDRCGKTYSEHAPTKEFEKAPPVLHLEFTPGEDPKGRLTVSFADLCPKCQSRVGDLVAAIKLDPKEDVKDEAKAKPDAKPKDETKGLDPSTKTSENKTSPAPAPAGASK